MSTAHDSAQMSLPDGAILITGAGSGIGRETAQSLAAAGAMVAVNDLNAVTAAQTCDLITAAGGTAVAVPGDVATTQGARDVVSASVAGLGRLTGVVNNVGLVRGGLLLDVTEEDWDFVMRVDCSSALFVSQAAHPHLVATGGPIVNVSSLCAVFPAPGAGSYNAAKAALVTLTQQQAIEWGPAGLRVNAIAPGMISGTHFSASSQDEGAAVRRGEIVPLRRTGRATDIAPVVVFLLSDASRYVTGQLLTVDGGLGISLQTFIPS